MRWRNEGGNSRRIGEASDPSRGERSAAKARSLLDAFVRYDV